MSLSKSGLVVRILKCCCCYHCRYHCCYHCCYHCRCHYCCQRCHHHHYITKYLFETKLLITEMIRMLLPSNGKAIQSQSILGTRTTTIKQPLWDITNDVHKRILVWIVINDSQGYPFVWACEKSEVVCGSWCRTTTAVVMCVSGDTYVAWQCLYAYSYSST